ncbi:unnamed protein product [Tilletia controversa]|uniref:sterol esterase n=3 Tax=Tilletia TaxID=13289 RepID=A0A8X7SU80_9BASI|nr:hypothetical protein CF336_g6593 [Tilletia laevis]KAE8190564.1 hypothetical protein CF328_g5936 [Tilletia controversa]KAE8253417.1 hypothetical protein A4X03_0g5900 [Tilletia caries]KAE8192179.1 hypothetical protein CF335_g5902 [Tilletia laevis]KAE8242486.1 hypothetical protein A4X06_0g6883 [Tilletia controversa]
MTANGERQPLLEDPRVTQPFRSGTKSALRNHSSGSSSGSSSFLSSGDGLMSHNNSTSTTFFQPHLQTDSSATTTGVGTPDAISRPLSAASLRVRVDKQSQATAQALAMYNRPPNGFDDYEEPDIWTTRGGAPLSAQHSLYRKLRLAWSQTLALTLSSSFLIFIVIWALSIQLFAAILRRLPSPITRTLAFVGLMSPHSADRPPKPTWERDWDDAPRWKKEKLVKDVRYYANSCGFEIVNEQVETDDGFYLRVNRIIDKETAHVKHSDGKGGFPVLIMHGLFQSSGSFVTSEERSLAFWLARRGKYQVFLGNNRGVFDMGHRKYSRKDPRFWDWNIRDLAVHDLPALVDYVRRETGYEKIGFIGHSQGNGTAFISLSLNMVPDLGTKLTYFGALAPAVFAGPLTTCFPFTALSHMDWQSWRRFFGVLDFIPLMKISYDWCPAYPYALLGYQMFAFLFAWTDANWLPRRKAKMFRFTPQPVSSASIFWWAGKDGFATRGCTMDPNAPQWFDGRFPPLSVYSGGMDFLVLTDPLIKRIQEQDTDVRLIRWKRQEEAEHCDHFWAADAVEWCFEDILEDIELTRLRYPEELEGEGKKHARVVSKFEEDVARKAAGRPMMSVTPPHPDLVQYLDQDGDQTPTNTSFNKGRFDS